jgi:hypothetical protein
MMRRQAREAPRMRKMNSITASDIQKHEATDVRPADCRELCVSGSENVNVNVKA